MPTMMKLGEVEVIAREGRKGETPSRITTTLYALIATLQDVVGPDNDALVIATVVHLLRAGRLTLHDTDIVNLLDSTPTTAMGDSTRRWGMLGIHRYAVSDIHTYPEDTPDTALDKEPIDEASAYLSILRASSRNALPRAILVPQETPTPDPRCSPPLREGPRSGPPAEASRLHSQRPPPGMHRPVWHLQAKASSVS